MKTLHQTWLLFLFYSRLSIRSPIWVLVALFQPICYLYFYGPLLQAFAANSGMSHQEIMQLFTPGLLIMVAFFGSMFVGFAMIDDLKSGVIEKLQVTPVSRIALLLGRSLRDGVTLIIQSLILIILSIPMGLHLTWLNMCLTLIMIFFVALFMAPISYALALTLKTEDAMGSIINFFAQPMLLLSGVLIPLSFAPAWLQHLSAINPLKYIVDACRSLFAGNLWNTSVAEGTIILAVLVTLALWWGINAYNKAME